MKKHEYVWLLLTLVAASFASYKLLTEFIRADEVHEYCYLFAGTVLGVNVIVYIGHKLFIANKVKTTKKSK